MCSQLSLFVFGPGIHHTCTSRSFHAVMYVLHVCRDMQCDISLENKLVSVAQQKYQQQLNKHIIVYVYAGAA